jgi:hypothetical protein
MAARSRDGGDACQLERDHEQIHHEQDTGMQIGSVCSINGRARSQCLLRVMHASLPVFVPGSHGCTGQQTNRAVLN